MLISATSPVHFHFSRGGGAVIAGRVAIWSGVGTASPQRVAVALFDHPTDTTEDQSVVLAPGAYVVVFQTFIRSDLNGQYRFNLQVDGQPVFAADQSGDVSTEPDKAAMLETQFDLQVN